MLQQIYRDLINCLRRLAQFRPLTAPEKEVFQDAVCARNKLEQETGKEDE